MSARDNRSEREERSEGFGVRDVVKAVGAVAGIAATAAVALNAIRRDRELDVEVEIEPGLSTGRGELNGSRPSRRTESEGDTGMRASGSRRGSSVDDESTSRSRRPRSIDGNTDRGRTGMS